jgi:hypothetical protein
MALDDFRHPSSVEQRSSVMTMQLHRPETDPGAPRSQRSAMPGWAGPLIGLVAAAVAVGTGLFVAALLDVDSPIDAVGSEFIDHTPKWLKTLPSTCSAPTTRQRCGVASI